MKTLFSLIVTGAVAIFCSSTLRIVRGAERLWSIATLTAPGRVAAAEVQAATRVARAGHTIEELQANRARRAFDPNRGSQSTRALERLLTSFPSPENERDESRPR